MPIDEGALLPTRSWPIYGVENGVSRQVGQYQEFTFALPFDRDELILCDEPLVFAAFEWRTNQESVVNRIKKRIEFYLEGRTIGVFEVKLDSGIPKKEINVETNAVR